MMSKSRGPLVVILLCLIAVSVVAYYGMRSPSFPIDLSSLPADQCWVFMRSHPEYKGDLWFNYITAEMAIKTSECRVEYTPLGQKIQSPPFCVRKAPDNYTKAQYNSVGEAKGLVGVLAVVARPLPFTSQEEDLRVLMNISKLIQPLCAKKKICVMRLVRMCCCDEYLEGEERYPYFVGGWALPADKDDVIMIVSIRLRYALYDGFKRSDRSFTKKWETKNNHRPHMFRPAGEIMHDVIHEIAHMEISGGHDQAWVDRFAELQDLYKDVHGHVPLQETDALFQ